MRRAPHAAVNQHGESKASGTTKIAGHQHEVEVIPQREPEPSFSKATDLKLKPAAQARAARCRPNAESPAEGRQTRAAGRTRVKHKAAWATTQATEARSRPKAESPSVDGGRGGGRPADATGSRPARLRASDNNSSNEPKRRADYSAGRIHRRARSWDAVLPSVRRIAAA